jgi:hypothetical protein
MTLAPLDFSYSVVEISVALPIQGTEIPPIGLAGDPG